LPGPLAVRSGLLGNIRGALELARQVAASTSPSPLLAGAAALLAGAPGQAGEAAKRLELARALPEPGALVGCGYCRTIRPVA
jgi:hypothetical protein